MSKITCKYTKEFTEAFKLLNSKLDDIDLARYLKITGNDLKKIREELGLNGIKEKQEK